MAEEQVLSALKSRFGNAIVDVYEHNERRAYMTVDKVNVPDVCRYMYKDLGGRLAIASGIDTRSGIEILYHFMFPKEHRLVTIKTKLKKPCSEIESIGAFLPAAIWIEREIYDILGVHFTNHPDMRRLIMADDWPEGVFPLRRDFKEPEK